jgi:hypothetical protein
MDGTNINELPASNGNNVSLSINETAQPTLDQNTIQQIISGLQKASTSGITQLPSRDIPQNVQHITHDEQVQAEYIPNSHIAADYIETQELQQQHQQQPAVSNLDKMYNEIQIPLLISILYFLFQLPIFRKLMFQYLPILFSKDGNINIYGYTFQSSLFGILFYILIKVMNLFNQF